MSLQRPVCVAGRLAVHGAYKLHALSHTAHLIAGAKPATSVMGPHGEVL